MAANIRSSNSRSAAKIFQRKPNPYSIAIYIILLFSFSFFIFIFYSKDVLEEDEKRNFRSEETPETPSRQMQLVDEHLWGAPTQYGLHPCVKPTTRYKASEGWDRYITVKSNGGLNQMRTGIADMVAVAYILNATLVIPQLDKRSFWQDSSSFSDVFDEEHFITTLDGDIRIVKELPKELEPVPRARKHFSSWAGLSYYEEIKQLWKDYQVIHVAKSDSRLANNDLPIDIQRLRCRALYYALQFSPPITSFGKVLKMHDGDTTEAGGASEIACRTVYSSPFEI